MNWIPERKKILQERIETLQNEINEEFQNYIIFLQEKTYGQVSAVFHHIELQKKVEILKLQALRLQRLEDQLKSLQELERYPN
jgi:chaperonin cofactor prefoldin